MKLFYTVDQDGKFTFSNIKMSENDEKCSMIEVGEEEGKKVWTSDDRPSIVDGKLVFTKVDTPPPSEEQIKREDLRQKAESGTLTTEDIKEALKIIL
jgi:hypothetical protein